MELINNNYICTDCLWNNKCKNIINEKYIQCPHYYPLLFDDEFDEEFVNDNLMLDDKITYISEFQRYIKETAEGYPNLSTTELMKIRARIKGDI